MRRTRRGLLLGAVGGLGAVTLVAACGGQPATQPGRSTPARKTS